MRAEAPRVNVHFAAFVTGKIDRYNWKMWSIWQSEPSQCSSICPQSCHGLATTALPLQTLHLPRWASQAAALGHPKAEFVSSRLKGEF